MRAGISKYILLLLRSLRKLSVCHSERSEESTPLLFPPINKGRIWWGAIDSSPAAQNDSFKTLLVKIAQIQVLYLFLSFIVLSCSSGLPECYDEGIKDLKIRWGEYYMKSNTIAGYQINSHLDLFEIKKDSAAKDYVETKIGRIEGDRFCRMIKIIQDTILTTQALAAPGEESRFVEYSNPGMNVTIRAVWNKKFQTYGSSGFREIYDSLEVFVSQKDNVE